MFNINVSFSEDIRDLAEFAAKRQGMSLDEFICHCVVNSVVNQGVDDPFYADKAVFSGDGPSDMAKKHDEYLYGDRQ